MAGQTVMTGFAQMTNHANQASRTSQIPTYIFRIDEIYERSAAPENVDQHGTWHPSSLGRHYKRRSSGSGLTNQVWWFNGDKIRPVPNRQVPEGATHYKTFTMFFGGGHGFYVMRGDATNPSPSEGWSNLMFDHNTDHSSSVCQVGTQSTMRVHNPNTSWYRMLLPDIYHGAPYPCAGRGGLTGELPIFLALIAFSMQPHMLPQVLPQLCQNGQWAIHNLPDGRIHKRGVVVSVYAYRDNATMLTEYEDGHFGKFYN